MAIIGVPIRANGGLRVVYAWACVRRWICLVIPKKAYAAHPPC